MTWDFATLQLLIGVQLHAHSIYANVVCMQQLVLFCFENRCR